MTTIDINALRNELQGLVALQVQKAVNDGQKLDKKAARYSAMAEYCIHVGRCSDPFSEEATRASLFDAVSSAFVNDPMNIPKEPIRGYAWMEVS